MNSIETLTMFFGWCSAINIGVILSGVLFFGACHEWAGRLSGKIFGVTTEEAKVTFFRVFQQYRLAVVVLFTTTIIMRWPCPAISSFLTYRYDAYILNSFFIVLYCK